MATYVLVHGAGDGGWHWHLLEAKLRDRGHDVIDGSHCVALSRPRELADRLQSFRAEL